MSGSDAALLAFGSLVGLVVAIALQVLIIRLGIAPLRHALDRIATEIEARNEADLGADDSVVSSS